MFIGLIIFLFVAGPLGWTQDQRAETSHCSDYLKGSASAGLENACFDFGDGQGFVPAHRHRNGGGWVSDYAHVVPEAYVGADSVVYGDAQVYKGVIIANGRVSGGILRGLVIVTGGGQVSGGLLETVSNDSDKLIINGGVVSGGHLVGSVQIQDQARVTGGMIVGFPTFEVLVSDKAQISGGQIRGKVYIRENAKIFGGEISGSQTHNVQIGGDVLISGGEISGNTILSGHVRVEGGRIEGTAFVNPLLVTEEAVVLEGARLTGSGVVSCGNFDQAIHLGGVWPHPQLVRQGCYRKEFISSGSSAGNF